MCGIAGYIGTNKEGIRIVLDSLHAMEERGYDSMGGLFRIGENLFLRRISIAEKKNCCAYDLIGPAEAEPVGCFQALGHTRWATFGERVMRNAHPHHGPRKLVYVSQNGNMDNFLEQKKRYQQRRFLKEEFYSETDTELIACLLEEEYVEHGDITKAIKTVMPKLAGANAIVVMCADNPNELFAIKKGSPLLLGKDEQKVMVASSGFALSSVGITGPYVNLNDNELAVISVNGWEINNIEPRYVCGEKNINVTDLSGFSCAMEGEIFLQPQIMQNVIGGRFDWEKGNSHLGGLKEKSRELRKVKTFHFVACGSSYYAGRYAELLLNRFGINARSWIASEFVDVHPYIDPDDAFIFISQSGDTWDTREALDEIKIKGNLRLGIVNVEESEIYKGVEEGIHLRVEREKGVAASKSFTGQLLCIALFALFVARQRKMTMDTGKRIIEEVQRLPEKVSEILAQAESIKALAKKYVAYNNCYFLGRYFNVISAEEGSLKLKELSGVHAESYPLGEMKHGPMALERKDFYNVVIIPDDSVMTKSRSNILGITSREGKVIAITNEGVVLPEVDDIITIPKTFDYLSPVLAVIPLQLFALYACQARKMNPDKPENLAKTVTTR